MATAELVTYSITDADIAATQAAYAGLMADTPKGYEEVRLAIAHCRDTRTAVEKRRVELKADALAWGKKVDAEAKRITTLLEAIEDPLKAKKQAVDDEKARLKEEAEAEKRRHLEEELRLQREAEDAARKAAQDAEDRRLADERARLEAERKQLDEERRIADEAARMEREAAQARQREADAALKAEREALDAERRAVQAEKDRLAREDAERQEATRRAREDADRVERERVAAIEREERLEAMKPDLQKLATFSAKISNLTAPAMKTPTGQSIATAVTSSLARVVRDLDAAVKGAA